MSGTLEGTGQKAQGITGPQGRLAWFLNKATHKPQCVPALMIPGLSTTTEAMHKPSHKTLFRLESLSQQYMKAMIIFLRCISGWTGTQCVDQATFKLRMPSLMLGLEEQKPPDTALKGSCNKPRGRQAGCVCVCVCVCVQARTRTKLFCFPQITFAKLQN